MEKFSNAEKNKIKQTNLIITQPFNPKIATAAFFTAAVVLFPEVLFAQDESQVESDECREFVSADNSLVIIDGCSNARLNLETSNGSTIRIESHGISNSVVVSVGRASGSANDEPGSETIEVLNQQSQSTPFPQIPNLEAQSRHNAELEALLQRLEGLTGSSQGIDIGSAQRRIDALSRNNRTTFNPRRIRYKEVRHYDGTSNNRGFPRYGATFEQLQRLGQSDYADGISSPAGEQRPNPREISNLVSHQGEFENIPNSYNTSDFLWQWGQFIDHDLGLTDGSTSEPINIDVPSGDFYFDPLDTGEVEIKANRATFDPATGLDAGNPREQENEITSWIDGSMVYGSSDERAEALREGGDSPYLATSDGNLLPFNVADLTNASGPVRDGTALYLAGDVRANEQIGLTAMHTLFVREHNRVAEELLRRFPGAIAEEIFQSARRIVIAEIQIITYEEFLPALLGSSTMPRYRGYRPKTIPNMYNEFTVAAFRLGHSSLSPRILRIDANNNEIEGGNVALQDAFFKAHELYLEENDIDPVLRGLAAQRHQAIDVKVVSDLRNFLFGAPGLGGLDLVSLNIQRGRDHGVGSYNDTREAMGFGRVTSFADITADAAVQEALAIAYDTVDDIDLWIGGLAETPLAGQGSQLGELFTAIVVRQFNEIRAADRFWHQMDLTRDEWEFVRGTTLSKIIRSNTEIGDELQDNVFFVH